MRHTEEPDAVFPHAYSFRDGMMHPGDKPGLGVEIDEKLAATHEYKRAYLPVAALEDGTTSNWCALWREYDRVHAPGSPGSWRRAGGKRQCLRAARPHRPRRHPPHQGHALRLGGRMGGD